MQIPGFEATGATTTTKPKIIYVFIYFRREKSLQMTVCRRGFVSFTGRKRVEKAETSIAFNLDLRF